jgi:hypothetical protein
VNYAFSNSAGVNISEFFLIDVVPFDRLPILLSRILRGDVEAMREALLAGAK